MRRRLRPAPLLRASRLGEWQVLKVRLLSFRAAGADMKNITEPVVISTDGRLQLTLQALRLETDPAGAVTLAATPSL